MPSITKDKRGIQRGTRMSAYRDDRLTEFDNDVIRRLLNFYTIPYYTREEINKIEYNIIHIILYYSTLYTRRGERTTNNGPGMSMYEEKKTTTNICNCV